MKEQLEHLLKLIDGAIADPKDADLFRQSVAQFLALEVNTIIEACRGLAISRPTLERWRDGLSAPHHLGRPSIMRWLKAKTEEKLQRELWQDLLGIIDRAAQNARDGWLFMTVVGKALKAEVVTLREFAGEFEAAPSTIERWSRGSAVPAYGVRTVVYRWLKEKIEMKLKD